MISKEQLTKLSAINKKRSKDRAIPSFLLMENESSVRDEDIELYDIGTYHTVYIGEILNNRYVILKKLEKNQYSTICLCKDMKINIHVIIKIFKAAPQFHEIGTEEFKILQLLYKKSRDSDWMRRLSNYKKRFGFKRILENETFCVK